MNRPYFSVGEEVIVKSISYPEVNGEHQVLGIIDEATLQKMADERGFMFVGGGDSRYYYDIGVPFKLKDTAHEWRHMGESALRKKHKPHEGSFSELMSSLKSGEEVYD